MGLQLHMDEDVRASTDAHIVRGLISAAKRGRSRWRQIQQIRAGIFQPQISVVL